MKQKILLNRLRHLCLLSLMLLLGSGIVWGEKTYEITFDSSNNGNNNVHWTITSITSLSYNDITWNTSVTGTTSITSSTIQCQIGSKNNPATNVTLSTTGFAGKQIKSVSLTGFCMSNTGPKLTITAGSTTILDSKALVKTTSTEYTSTNTSNVTLGATDAITLSIASSAKAAIVISKVKVVYIDEQAVSITTQPVGAIYTQGDVATPLSIVAEGSPAPTYQWYSNTVNSTEGATAIGSATNASYTPSTENVGTTYYYCVAKNTITAGEQTVTSDIVAVTVNAATGYKVTCNAKPAEGGTVSADPYNNIAQGTEVTLTATPNAGYTFASWYAIDGSAQEITITDNRFNMPASDVTVEGTFTPIAVTGVTLNKTELSLQKDYSETLTATITPSDALVQTITWASSNPAVATVDENGKVTAVKKGTANITATSNNSIVATCVVTVTAVTPWEKVTSAPADWSGDYLLVYEKSTTEAYVWTGVDAASCYAAATITDNTINQPANAVSITIAPMEGGYSIKVNGGDNNGKYTYGTSGSNKINFGDDAALNTLAYGNNCITIISNTSFIQFNPADNNLRFRYFKSGTTTQKNVQLYKKASSDPSISLNKETLSLSKGTTGQLTATVKNSEATVAWSSNAEGVATVSATGLVTAVAEGTATITAKITEDEIDYTATCEVTVTPTATVTSVIISPETVSPIYIGKTTTLTAAVVGENDPAQTVTWTSSNDEIATVENGVVTGVATGTVTITATSTVDDTKYGSREVEIITTANTAETAYTTAEVIDLIDASADNDVLTANVFVKGQISKIDSYSEEYKSITYWLDDDAFEVYSGKGIGGADFSSAEDLAVGDKVVVTGNVKKFGSIYEFTSGNQLVSREEGTKTTPTFTATYKTSLEIGTADEYSVTYDGDGTLSIAESSEGAVANVSISGYNVTVTPVAEGTTTITITASETGTYYGAKIEYTLTVTKPYSKDDYKAVVSKYGDKYYAMVNNVSGGIANAVEVYSVNNKVLTTDADPDTISWQLTTDGYVKSASGQFVSFSKTNLSLTNSTTNIFTTSSDDNGSYWTSSSRSFIYKNGTGFKTYATSNAGTEDYGTLGYLMTFSDGYTRATTSGNYGTICLPYAVSVSDRSGATFYSIAGKRVDGSGNPTSIVLTVETGDLAAGQPYIFQATANILIAAYTGAEETTAGSNNGLYGSYSSQGFDDTSDIYLLKGNQICPAGSGATVGANKAYIDMTDVLVYNSEVKGAVEFSLDGATGISNVDANVDANAGTIFNLSGQRVNKLHKGINIVNGKKVLY